MIQCGGLYVSASDGTNLPLGLKCGGKSIWSIINMNIRKHFFVRQTIEHIRHPWGESKATSLSLIPPHDQHPQVKDIKSSQNAPLTWKMMTPLEIQCRYLVSHKWTHAYKVHFQQRPHWVVALSCESYFTGLQELGNRLNKTKEATQMAWLNQAPKYSVHSVSPKCRLPKFICIFTNIHSHLTQCLKREEWKRGVYRNKTRCMEHIRDVYWEQYDPKKTLFC